MSAAVVRPPFRRTFSNSVAICFEKYVDFEDRAPRAEYWYFVLFQVICFVGLAVVGAVFFGSHDAGGVGALLSLGLFLPTLAVSVRRLHDIDRTGFWYFMVLVPVAGTILLLVWFCTRGTEGPNRFGADPLPPNIP